MAPASCELYRGKDKSRVENALGKATRCIAASETHPTSRCPSKVDVGCSFRTGHKQTLPFQKGEDDDTPWDTPWHHMASMVVFGTSHGIP